MDFNDIKVKVSADDRGKANIVLPKSAFHMSNEGKLVTDSMFYDFNNHSLGQFFGRLEIPVKYGKRMFNERPDLMAGHVNHLKNSLEERELLFRVRKPDIGNTGMVRAVLSDKYSVLDNANIITALEQVFDRTPGLNIKQFVLSETFFHLRITADQLSNEALKLEDGTPDILAVGVDIDNSETGGSAVRIIPIVYRLICANGLRGWVDTGAGMVARHIYLRSEEMYQRMATAVAQAFQVGDEVLQAMLAASDIEVEEPIDVIAKLLKTGRYSQAVIDNAQSLYLADERNDGDGTKYGVVNALTAVARDMEPEKRIALETYAGRLLRFQGMWPVAA